MDAVRQHPSKTTSAAPKATTAPDAERVRRRHEGRVCQPKDGRGTSLDSVRRRDRCPGMRVKDASVGWNSTVEI
jgi:hypothetical protein